MSPEPRPGIADTDTAHDEARLGAGHERRLHPLSWLFVLLLQIKGFALPLIALVVFGRSDDSWQWWGLVAVAVLTLGAVLRYFTYRFRIDADELVIRSGFLQRNERHVPFARIQSVVLHRNVLHRLVGVADVRLESAVGGDEPEAQMRVLSMADAAALERLVEHHRGAMQPAPATPATRDTELPPQPGAQPPAQTRTLLHLPPIELVKLGLASHRGTVLLAAAFGALVQFGGEQVWERAWEQVRERAGQLPPEAAVWSSTQEHDLAVWVMLAGVVLTVVSLTAKFVLGVVLTVVRDFGFTLEQAGPRLSVERGLLTRVRASTPLRRIQHWTLRQGMVLRWFGRSSLRVETAALRAGNEEQTISDLAPIAPPASLDALLRDWLPNWPGEFTFQSVHPRAWQRLCLPPCVMTLAACVGLLFFFGAAGVAALLLIPFWIWLAHKQAAACGYAVNDDFVVWRSGWLDRRISFARIEKLQGLRLVQSPFDRRHGMASLHVDTAGAHPLGHRLHLRHLPEARARALYRRVSTRLAKTPWQW